MKIFRSKRDGQLYTIEYVKPMKYTGSWYEITRLFGESKPRKVSDLDYFSIVSER